MAVIRLFAWIVALAYGSTGVAGERLIGTGGVSQIEGASGGGLTPWATIGGYSADGAHSGTAFFSQVRTGDFQLDVVGGAWTFDNRVEISYARQQFDLGTLGSVLGMPGTSIRQDVFGAKVRVAGDLLYGRLPQFAIGLQYKRLRDPAVAALVGGQEDAGTDFYLAASRVTLAAVGGRNLLWSAAARATEANQLGLLGFGGDGGGYKLLFEGSVGVLLDRHTLVGVEYRQKPDNLSAAVEEDWASVYVAYLPSRSVSFTAAYADLGSLGGFSRQAGFYLSIQAAF